MTNPADPSAGQPPDGLPERRRPGRLEQVSPALLPLLRGAAAIGGRTGCQACRAGDGIFPFSVAFQPIFDLETCRIDGHEALVRGPQGEPALQVLGQVTPENLYAFDQACRVKAIELAARLGLEGRLNINFLPNAVDDPAACIQTTLRTARRTGFPLDRLTFEIVESEAIADTGHLLAIIAEYRRHGFQIALDDFGTGHSGLARLVELRPDIIKLDRILVQGCDADRHRLAVLAALLRLGGELGVKVVLEGVETPEELAALRDIGGRFVQGFLLARPSFETVVRECDVTWPAVGIAPAGA